MVIISLDGLEEVSIYVDRRLSHFHQEDLMRTIAATVKAQTMRRINSEKTAPSGAAWAPLKASTIARKGTNNILVDKGRLLGSIRHIALSDEAEVGTNVFYGKFHQYGTKSKTGGQKMPARPFIGLSSNNQSEIWQVINAFIARQLA